MRIRFRTTSSATSSRRRRASSGSPPTTGSTASTWKTTASNASTPGYEDNGPTAEQVFSVAAAADGTIFCAATGWGIACYDKALGRLSALNVPQFNSSEIRAVYYGGQNTLLLHTVQEELVRIRYELSATGSMEVREKVGLFPEGGVKSVFDSRTALYLVTADAEIYRYERRDGELAAVGKFPRVVRCALSPNMATITCW